VVWGGQPITLSRLSLEGKQSAPPEGEGVSPRNKSLTGGGGNSLETKGRLMRGSSGGVRFPHKFLKGEGEG